MTGATHVALCDDIGSYFIHWCKVLTHVALCDKAAKQLGLYDAKIRGGKV